MVTIRIVFKLLRSPVSKVDLVFALILSCFCSALVLSNGVSPANGQTSVKAQVSEESEGWLYSGKNKMEANDFKGAISDFSKAIQINPNSIKAYGARGIVRYYLKDYAGALDDSKIAAQLCLKQNDKVGYQLLTNFIKALETEMIYHNQPQTS
jgi:tetratricopeptide (TPR) repeat protein